MRILVVEDETAIAQGLKFNFEQEGFEVILAGDGTAALDQFQASTPPVDLVLLDLMLPGMSGYETCRELRKLDAHVPILVLSARQLSEDKALAFDAGTDQYITKPFHLPELLSRVRNLLKRGETIRDLTAESESPVSDQYHFGIVEIDFSKFELTVNGRTHSLTTMELQLLKYFIENEGAVLSRSQILKDVWEESADISTRSIDNFVSRLRKLIEDDSATPRHILSVRGTGYRFLATP